MAESLYSVLSRNHTPALPLAERKNLSLKEQQTLYRLEFDRRRSSVVFHIDGDIVKDGNKCDFLVLAKQKETSSEEDWKAIFVELKGTDVVHALTQLDASMSDSRLKHPSVKERHARIVAKSFPSSKSNPKFEKAKRDFKIKHKCSLKQVSSGTPDLIS